MAIRNSASLVSNVACAIFMSCISMPTTYRPWTAPSRSISGTVRTWNQRFCPSAVSTSRSYVTVAPASA